MAFYAALNTRANLNNGDHGFLNTWAIARFDSRAERDAFVEAKSDKLAKPVTRKEAASIFAATYLCVGETVPVGGLFGHNEFNDTRFYEMPDYAL